jgi:hypothetical protein
MRHESTSSLFHESKPQTTLSLLGQEERQRMEAKFAPLMREELELGSLVSYMGNKKIPLLRLYRYKEAFAFSFVNEFIRRFGLTKGDYVLDPFVGMGTTTFCSFIKNIPSIGIDKLPLAAFIAHTIPTFLLVEPGDIEQAFQILRQRAPKAKFADVALDVAIMKVAFPQATLDRLRQWKSAIDELSNPMRDIFLLLFFSILEETSHTSKDGQFLRLKRDKTPPQVEDALYRKVRQAEQDLSNAKRIFNGEWSRSCLPEIHLGDTRDLSSIPFEKAPTAIFTSPPYVNRYDYTRSYSLELCFHFVKSFAELKDIRFGILRSHIESKVDPKEAPNHPVIKEVVEALEEKSEELNNPRIPLMITAYFIDMEKAIREWARVLAPGAQVAMVVDNVRFEGEMIPVDLVLSEFAEEAGFKVRQIIVSRYKGNSSQQMKKYGRMPMRESVVVWRLEN